MLVQMKMQARVCGELRMTKLDFITTELSYSPLCPQHMHKHTHLKIFIIQTLENIEGPLSYEIFYSFIF